MKTETDTEVNYLIIDVDLINTNVPSPDQDEKEQSQHNVSNVGVDIVEGAEYAERVRAVEVIVADILVTSHM